MYSLSKVVQWILDPVHFLLAVFVFGTLIRWFNRGLRSAFGRLLQLSALAGVVFLFVFPLGSVLLAPLEDRFPPFRLQSEAGRLDGIIILGGSLDLRASMDHLALIQTNSASDRLLTAVEALAQTDVDLYLTGGDGALTERIEVGESVLVAEWLGQQGFNSERLNVESDSRNTAEHPEALLMAFPELGNGLYGLVTSAFHMPRAVGVFHAAGIDVVAIPVDYRANRRGGLAFGQGIEEWERLALALREWVGLLSYRALGRSLSVFPGPGDTNLIDT